mgnify:CR=1 FL=1
MEACETSPCHHHPWWQGMFSLMFYREFAVSALINTPLCVRTTNPIIPVYLFLCVLCVLCGCIFLKKTNATAEDAGDAEEDIG